MRKNNWKSIFEKVFWIEKLNVIDYFDLGYGHQVIKTHPNYNLFPLLKLPAGPIAHSSYAQIRPMLGGFDSSRFTSSDLVMSNISDCISVTENIVCMSLYCFVDLKHYKMVYMNWSVFRSSNTQSHCLSKYNVSFV